MNWPTVSGYYWAKWKIASPGTTEGNELTPSNRWEVVELWPNTLNAECGDLTPMPHDPEGLETFMVSVPGVENSQTPDSFFWGPGPLPPPVSEAK